MQLLTERLSKALLSIATFHQHCLTSDNLETKLGTALADILLSAANGGSIYFAGVGKNVPLCKKSAATFRSLGFSAHELDPVHALHGDLGALQENDTLVCMSKSGTTDELLSMLRYIAKNRSALGLGELTIVMICVGQNSERDQMLQGLGVFVIDLPQISEQDAWNRVPTNSLLMQQLVIDMLAVRAAEVLDYSHKDFVLHHPGGAIGRGN